MSEPKSSGNQVSPKHICYTFSFCMQNAIKQKSDHENSCIPQTVVWTWKFESKWMLHWTPCTLKRCAGVGFPLQIWDFRFADLGLSCQFLESQIPAPLSSKTIAQLRDRYRTSCLTEMMADAFSDAQPGIKRRLLYGCHTFDIQKFSHTKSYM